MHEVIDQLAKEAEGLRKFQSFFDLEKAADEPLEDDELDYCADVFVDMEIDDVPGITKANKNIVATHAANMLRERLEKLRNILEWKMTKATSDALKA